VIYSIWTQIRLNFSHIPVSPSPHSSNASLKVFEFFITALQTGTNVPVTKENVIAISLLANEFWLEELFSDSSALMASSAPELITALFPSEL
jgi:hypothetical protein